MISLLGDGVSLPASFSALAESCSAAAAVLESLELGIAALIPPRERWPRDDYGYPYPRHPNEEMLHGVALGLRAALIRILPSRQCSRGCFMSAFSRCAGHRKTHVLAEVCSRYAEQGGVVLFSESAPDSFRAPFRSRWPRIWTEARYRSEKDAVGDRPKLFASVELGPEPGYGDWGR